MHNANKPRLSELPTTGQLLKSTVLAAGVAGALLVTVVLPAEYGVDPTRVGSVLGLTDMGRIKRQLAAEAEVATRAEAASTAPAPAAAPPAAAGAAAPATPAMGARSDRTVITLKPNAAAEIKLVMEEGARARFVWSSSGGKVNFDTHADRPGVNYHGYGKGSSQREAGELTAAFTGSHGWFWRNRTGKTVTVTLETSGAYSEVKRVV
ncbi:MAG: transmembrane anchor protein [Phenylobacterium sp.]|uniref:transmembrane anchor protein n=1 Tax=Phenylobacterium sp. TaxID=1871053 RepID=UPI001214875F|nr:transmembrane anchor protein [Phenylobacterium sp.]TAJ68758.1 MAG: transmembrane anchor protein [Phenylobacterium sp.]